MLFDPAKEQFHLPARAIELGDDEGWEKEIVGEENQGQFFSASQK
jgi:hypothetical protein